MLQNPKNLNLIEQIKTCQNLLKFDNICLPFELIQSLFEDCQLTFTAELLKQLSETEPETFEAWAIALSKTLATQLELLNSWQLLLDSLPISANLKQRINDRNQSLKTLITEKSELLKSANLILSQEQQIIQETQELKTLKSKIQQLTTLEAELQTANLEQLRKTIAEKAIQLEPQQQILTDLQQQKTQLDEQITALQQQQTLLKEEITYWQSRQNHLEQSTRNSVSELITLTQLQRQRLSEALAEELAHLETQKQQLIQQQESYNQVQQQIQQTQTDFETYHTVTQELITMLNSHYQTNVVLGKLLPVNCEKIDHLLKTVQETLAEIDQELSISRKKQEQIQQKIRFTF